MIWTCSQTRMWATHSTGLRRRRLLASSTARQAAILDLVVLVTARMLRISVCFLLLSLAVVPIHDRLYAQRSAPTGMSSVRGPLVEPTSNPYAVTVRPVLADTTDNSSDWTVRGGVWGAGVGAVVGGTTGSLMGLSQCDAAGSHRGCITKGAVGGVVIGAVIGYGVGWIIGNYH